MRNAFPSHYGGTTNDRRHIPQHVRHDNHPDAHGGGHELETDPAEKEAQEMIVANTTDESTTPEPSYKPIDKMSEVGQEYI